MSDEELSVLEGAVHVVSERENIHGSAVETHERIAALWEAYLDLEGVAIDAKDAAIMLALLKIARARDGQPEKDTFVDLAGYADCAYLCLEDQQRQPEAIDD